LTAAVKNEENLGTIFGECAEKDRHQDRDSASRPCGSGVRLPINGPRSVHLPTSSARPSQSFKHHGGTSHV
jgi:hypothetical protein